LARQRALLLTQAIEEDFWDANKGAYLEASPRRTKGLPYSMMWANGVQFTVLAGAVGNGETRYAAHMRSYLDQLDQFWNSRLRLYSAYFGGTNDVYYDDNQWMILAYVEAYEATHDKAYLDKAVVVTEGCLAGVDDVLGGGSYWHVDRKKYPTKNTCSNGPLATALLRVRAHIRDQDTKARYLEQAERILRWTRDTLQGERGLMLDNIRVGDRKITRWTFTYNQALMIQGWLELHATTANPDHLAAAIRLGKASSHWLKAHGPSPEQEHYDDATFFTVHLVEALLRLHEATGDPKWLAFCDETADFYWHSWRRGTTYKLLDVSAVARMQWLLAKGAKGEPPPPHKGVRYVRIEASGKNKPLVLAEVQVVSDGKDVAAGGKTYQSSVADNAFAAYAVDGAMDSVARTSPDKGSAWWEVELPQPCNVQRVRIRHHPDGEAAMSAATLVLLNSQRHVVRSGPAGFLED
jgi:hypothetical protein